MWILYSRYCDGMYDAGLMNIELLSFSTVDIRLLTDLVYFYFAESLCSSTE